MAVLATMVAAVLVGWDLGARSLWLDEASTVEMAGRGWTHLWERMTTREANMGLYYVLLHGWLVLGRDEATVRALSAVATVATVPLAYRLGVRTIGPLGAAAGVVLLATQPFFVRYGQEARSYALMTLLVVAASVAVLRAIERPTPARWAGWVTVATLAIYAHLLAIPALGVHVVTAARRIRWTTVAAAAVVVGVLAAPLLWFALVRDTGQIDWLGPPTPAQVAWVLARLTGDAGWLGVAVYAACLAMAGRRGSGFLLALAGVPFALVLVVSPLKPLFLDRYLLPCVPPLALLAGAGLVRLPRRTLAIAAVVALQAVGLVRVYAEPSTEDWRGAAAVIRAAERPGDAVACWVDFVCVALDYYFAPPAGGPPIVRLVDAIDDPAALAAIIDAHPRLWLVLSHVQVGQSDRRAMLARIEAALAAAYVVEETQELREVTLRRYVRQTSPNTR